MKQRIMSAAIALVVLAVVLMLFNTPLFNCIVAVLVVIALYELLHAVGCAKNKLLLGVSCLFGATIPLVPHTHALRVFPVMGFMYIAVLLLIMIARHQEISALQIGFAFFVSLVVPFSITVCIYMRDQLGAPSGLFLTFMAMGCAWLSDTGAFFVGQAFGKHKLAPTISPKKTVEGAIGGVVFGTGLTLLLALLFSWIAGFFAVDCGVQYLALILCLPFVTIAGILGDLAASVIKRQMHIKDYGNIMPGHGGVVDRFDSVFFTAPMIFFLAHFITFIHIR